MKLLFRCSGGVARNSDARQGVSRIPAVTPPARTVAIYCVLDEAIHSNNPTTGSGRTGRMSFRDPDGAAVTAFAKNIAVVHVLSISAVAVICRSCAAQATAVEPVLKIGLYHDLALATYRAAATCGRTGSSMPPDAAFALRRMTSRRKA